MYLQKLEIQGFKSFAQKTTLEFNRQLTAVVGPNGSGKSNIADAIRWVLGEQSLKLLRGKRAEDVIFAGSDLKSRLGMAEVSLFLNNEDRQAPVDFGEIVVTRRVYRDGQSEYLLNGSQVRLQDVQILLAQSNFGQKTYSVIGQGMVDSILLSSPAERKEFFEEATGVKQYQLKREQAIQKLTTTYENMEQAEALLNEIEPRLKALTRQVKRLERREELERELREMQKVYFRFRYHQVEGRRGEVAGRTNALEGKIKEQHAAVNKLEAKLKTLEGAELVSNRWQQLQEEQAGLRRELTELMRQQAVAEAREEVGHVKRGEGEIAWLKQRTSELTAEAKHLSGRESALQGQLVAQRANLERKASEQAELIREFDELVIEEGTAWLAPELERLAHDHAELKTRLASAASVADVRSLAAAVGALEQKVLTLVKRLSRGNATSDLNKRLAARDTLVNEIGTLRGALESLEREQRDITAAKLRLEQAVAKVESALKDAPASSRETGETKVVSAKISDVESKLHKVEADLASFHSQAEAKKSEFFEIQRQLTSASATERTLAAELHEVGLELARLETKIEDLEREMAQEIPPELVHTVKEPGDVQPIDEGSVALELQKLKHQLELTGGIEPEVVQEYQQTKTRFDFLETQTEDLRRAIGSLETVIRDLDVTIEERFLKSFKVINEKFGKYFQLLFNGGRAQLILQKGEPEPEEGEAQAGEAADDAQEAPKPSARERFLKQEKLKATLFSGVEIQATPPGKKLSSITALSGGEKALASIALICSIISNNPSPFVALDEVDAALDEANSERYAAILDSLMDRTQFITITHNRATMKRAAILYGVTMGEDGVSKLLSVKLDEAKDIAGAPKGVKVKA